jgi:hypothetical protein
VLAPPVVDVIQLAVQQVGFADGAYFDLAGDPVGAAAGHFLLLQAVGQRQALVFNLEGFFVGFFRIKRLNEACGSPNRNCSDSMLSSCCTQGFVGVNCEVGRHHGKATSAHRLFAQEFRHFPPASVISNARFHANPCSMPTKLMSWVNLGCLPCAEV